MEDFKFDIERVPKERLNSLSKLILDICYKAKHDKKIMDQYKREKANNDVLQGNRSN